MSSRFWVVCGSAVRSLKLFVFICLYKIRKSRHNKKENTLYVWSPSDFVVSLGVVFVSGKK